MLMIEADLLRKINFDDMIKYFARHKSRKKELWDINVCFLLSMIEYSSSMNYYFK